VLKNAWALGKDSATLFLVILRLIILAAVLGASPSLLRAQDNYEIQVYGSELVERGHTMFEVHSNFTASGRSTVEDGVIPTDHAWHETLEITHGFTSFLEVGFYTFTSANVGHGWSWVGNHIRPRVTVPKSWGWPVGVSLSQEIGYQRRAFSADTWTWEIRPIVDHQSGRFYWSVNPTLEIALKGEGAGQGVEFAPNVALTYDITPKVTGALEYYGSWGPVSHLSPTSQQEHQLFGAVDLNLSPDWEVNFGVGVGLTNQTDGLLIKLILGRRIAH
jgi:hypothetical protein